MPKLTNKKKLNEWSELYLGNINACLSNFLMWEICRQDQHWVLTLLLKAKKIKLPPNEFFSWKTTNKIFICLLAPFILQNIKKNLRSYPELWGCVIFGPICPEQNVFGKNHYYYFHSSTFWPFPLTLCKI